jgi:bla regulator protein BlaR1
MTPITSHLIQSTLFAAIAALLTLAFRKNRAQVRYALWLSASVKFLIPFSLLIAAGSHFGRRTVVVSAHFAPSPLIAQIAEPFVTPVPAQPAPVNWLLIALAIIWIIGFAFVLSNWYRRWRNLETAIQGAALREPGVYGIFRPILLLPARIADHLTPAQLKSILDHELCHLRRRDNLAATIHMTVEAIFWFHPLVWWLGARLMEERERACDEEVLRLGNEPQTYAEAILKICELYLESPLPCISGITGSDLRKRIETIMAHRTTLPLSRPRATLLAAAATTAFAIPIVIGILNAPILIAESPAPLAAQPAPTAIPKFESVSIKPCRPTVAPTATGFHTCAPLYTFIKTAYATTASPNIFGGPIWISMDHYRIDPTPIGTPTKEMMRGPMLQALLESRFKLKVHREMKQSAMYALTIAPGGPKLQAVPDGACAPVRPQGILFPMPPPPPPSAPPTSNCGAFSGRTPPGTPNELKASSVIANGADLDTVAEHLASVIGRSVINKTGLKGTFTFRVTFANADTPAGPLAPESVFTVLEKQLGLKLEPTTGPREFIYIDHAERP